MKIIGLSGGIASGKNFVAEVFRKKGAAIFDADLEVHKIFSCDSTVYKKLQETFPEAVNKGEVDRDILGKIVFQDANKLEYLEKLIHPLVRNKYLEFIKNSRLQKKKMAVLNIPLLCESNSYKCDFVLAIAASKLIQKHRFLKREKERKPNINFAELEKKFLTITKKQISLRQRMRCADFVIYNTSKVAVIRQINYFLKLIK